MHRRNAVERTIRTFKAHFLAILAGVCPKFPSYMWDKLLQQAKIALNLMRKSIIEPNKSAWEYFHGRPFIYNATPLGPLGIPVIIHNKPSQQKSWDFRGRGSFSAGAALNHYRCQHAIDAGTKAMVISDTVEFRHQYLTQPGLTPLDSIIHALHTLTSALHQAPSITSDAQLQAIDQLRTLFDAWHTQSATCPTYVPPQLTN